MGSRTFFGGAAFASVVGVCEEMEMVGFGVGRDGVTEAKGLRLTLRAATATGESESLVQG